MALNDLLSKHNVKSGFTRAMEGGDMRGIVFSDVEGYNILGILVVAHNTIYRSIQLLTAVG